MASVVFIPRLNHTTPELWIPELVVSGRYRNKGIGKKLMSSCQKLAKKKKCFRIRLESGNQRKAAQRFYRKIGFDNVAVTLTKKP
jgi:ribosomal protein S18 acetylase RimI-like enzyme